MKSLTLDQILKEEKRCLYEGLYKAQFSSMEEFQERNYLIFSKKEADILARYTKLKNGKLPVDLLIESINFKDYNSLLSNWKLNEKEVEEFKAKLERLMS